MVWEIIRKEMTITKVLLGVVALLLCCFLTFGLPHRSEKNPANNEQGIEMLNLFREFLEKNESHSEHPDAIHGASTTASPKSRKFYSISPSAKKPEPDSRNTKQGNLNVGDTKQVTPLHPSTNSTSRGPTSGPKLDLVIVFDTKKQPEKEDSSILDVKNTGVKHSDRIMMNHVIFSKTVRVSRVEEVFEDLASRNVRRIIKEDRAEKIEVSKNKEMEAIGNKFGIKDLFSL